MTDTSTQDFYARQAADARGPEPDHPKKRKGRRIWRIAAAAGASLILLVGLAVGSGYLYINHVAGSVQRIKVAALTAKDQPAAPPGSLNILLTASGLFAGENAQTGLIELLHLDADHHDGAVISFPANLLVSVPGHGEQRLGVVTSIGGPSLLIRTVEHLTDVRINHYSRITYSGLSQVIGSMDGVDVIVPYPTTSFGVHFHAGENHITAYTAGPYVRQPAVSQVTRTALQENLFRAILHKIANRRYFVFTDWRVINAVAHAVSVDSDLSNSQIISLAMSLGHLEGRDGVSIDVPTMGPPHAGYTEPVYLRTRLDDELWQAIRDNRVLEFALHHPSTVTPVDPG
jgi:LCP family protein required for cell wall assembly